MSAYHHAHHYQSMCALHCSKSCLMALWQWRSGRFAVIKLIYCASFEQPVMTTHLYHKTHLNLHLKHFQDEKDGLDTLSETVFQYPLLSSNEVSCSTFLARSAPKSGVLLGDRAVLVNRERLYWLHKIIMTDCRKYNIISFPGRLLMLTFH